ncbi:hypothetical protein FS842_005012 [Serendipita sp. 407]|nr:hypothetical protein FS842_005012 [Serendipita sp. 407]
MEARRLLELFRAPPLFNAPPKLPLGHLLSSCSRRLCLLHYIPVHSLLVSARLGALSPPSQNSRPPAMDTAERPTPVGFSDLFPILPLFSVLSFVCCMLVLPGFIKTRVLALTTYTLWLALGNLIICINTCVWRNNTRNIPIYSDFVAHLWANYTNIIYLNIFCFHKFVWNITKPHSSRKFYDNRIKYNRLDVFMTTILPILWMPVVLVTLNGRYIIIEDLGPLYIVSKSLETILIRCVPTLLITIASVWVVVLTMINIWHARHIEPPKRVNELNHLPKDQTVISSSSIAWYPTGLSSAKASFRAMEDVS